MPRFGLFDSSNIPLVEVKHIPFLPTEVDPEKLNSNGLILTDEEIAEINVKNIQEDMRHSKHSLLIPHSVIKTGEDLYAIHHDYVLGEGGFGKVKCAQQVTGEHKGKWYAYKIVNISEQAALAAAHEEHKTIQELEPKSVPKRLTRVRRSSSKLMDQYDMIMNLAHGLPLNGLLEKETEWQDNFASIIDIKPLFSSAFRIQIVFDIVQAVSDFISERKKIHRDLKLENVIYNLVGQNALLIDVATAKTIDADKVIDTKLPGTSIYIAPELREEKINQLENDDYVPSYIFNEKTEVYAVGIIIAHLFKLLDVEKAFEEKNDITLCRDKSWVVNVEDDLFVFNETIDCEHRKDILNLICMMTDRNPEKRITLEKALKVLSSIKQELLEEKISVGVLNIAGYPASDETSKTKLLEALDNYDEIWFIDVDYNRDQKVYVKVKNELEKKGFLVGDKVFTCTDEDASLNELEDYLGNRKIASLCEKVTLKLDASLSLV